MRFRLWLRRMLMPEASGPQLVDAAPRVPVRTIFRRFWPDARPYRKWIAIGMVFAVVVPAIETAEIWLFKLVVDEVLVPGDLGPLGWIALAYVSLTLIGAVINFGDSYLAAWVGERFVLNLRTRVFAHIQRLSAGDVDKRRVGDLVSRMSGDVAAIETVALAGIADLLSAVFRILFFGGALLYLEWSLATVALVIAPLFWLTARSFSRLTKNAAREKRRRSGSLSAVTEESLANASLVQAYNRQDAEVARFRREGEGIMEAELASTRIKALFTPVIDMLELAAALLVIGLGTWAVTEGRLTIGGLLVFLAYLTQLLGPVRDLSSLANSVFAAAAGAERVIELLDEEPRVADRPGAHVLTGARGVVEIDDVSFTYPGADAPALRNVSLRAEPGETVALVGPSGAGKSTLARMILRLHDPDAGVVRLDGHDVRDVTLASLRDSMAVLMQETLVLQASARENIAVGRPDATDDEIAAAARAAGADGFLRALPEGYDTMLDARGRNLSGGQRQRVAIARALVRDAPLLILDEPSTGLDELTRRRLVEPLRELMRGRTSIVISHDLLTVRDADRIVVLDAGRVAEEGTHSELLARDGLYARLFHERETAADAAGAVPA
ncbi:ABC transporter ATP-binding protein [Miltoncostaea oceani]|uniref:ABC transporter ATP-binding protein n=1 Tax=Miltoncostaea oceani TaxID=2843216 RepID=UPI001FE687D5|nr:ABC transporter ATP-binding protein [Miltoncostaea oceani]